MDVRIILLFFFANGYLIVCGFMQIAISAGHEFLISTESKYSEICDDKVMFMDYVSRTFAVL